MPPEPAFRRLWLAGTVSQLGTQVSELAIPFIAIATLHATPFQVGLLMAVEYAPILLLSLPAGAWTDRVKRRPLLITSDLGRALLLSSIPVAFGIGRLGLGQLYLVGFLVGSLSVIFDTAAAAYLPAVIRRDRLVSANSMLQVSEQGASVVGPALAGWLISLLMAAFAVAADVLSYVFSAAVLTTLTVAEAMPTSEGRSGGGGFVAEIGDGIRYVIRHPILRPMAITSGLTQFFGRMVMAVLLIYLLRRVGLTAAAVGTVFSIGSAGFVLGALIAPRLSSKLGLGRTLTGAAVVASLGPLVYAVSPVRLAPVFVAAGFFLYGVAALTWTVNAISLRQAITSPARLGRVSATMRLVSWGAIPLGSLAGGALGSIVGLRQTIVIGAAGALAGSIPVLLSGIRRISSLGQASVVLAQTNHC